MLEPTPKEGGGDSAGTSSLKTAKKGSKKPAKKK